MSRYAAFELRFCASFASAAKLFCNDSRDWLNAFTLRGSLLAALLRAVDFRAVDLRAVVLRRVVAFLGAGIESLSSWADGRLPCARYAFRPASATPVFVTSARRRPARAVPTTPADRPRPARVACRRPSAGTRPGAGAPERPRARGLRRPPARSGAGRGCAAARSPAPARTG